MNYRMISAIWLLSGIILIFCYCSKNPVQDTPGPNAKFPTISFADKYSAVPQGMKISLPLEIFNTPNLASLKFKIEISDSIGIQYDTTILSYGEEQGAIFEQVDNHTFSIRENNDYDVIVNDSGYVNFGEWKFTTIISSTDSIPVSITIVPLEIIRSNGDTIPTENMKTPSVNFDLMQMPKLTIGYWPMDLYNLDTLYDVSPNRLNGIMTDVQFVTGAVGTGIDLAGEHSHIRIPNNPALAVYDELTIAMWIRPVAQPVFESTILSKFDTAGNTLYEIRYFQGDNSIILISEYLEYPDYLPSFNNFCINNFPSLDGLWHFIAFTLKYNDYRSFTAILDTSRSFGNTNCTLHNALACDTNALFIGCFNPEVMFFDRYSGCIDEVLILNKALPEDLLKQLYYSYYFN